MEKIKVTLLFYLILLCSNIYPSYIPEIKQRNDSDLAFKQLRLANEQWHKRNNNNESILLFNYKVDRDDDIFSVAAAFNMNYDTIASLNSIDKASDFKPNTTLLIPSAQGIFIRESNSKLNKILVELTKSIEPIILNLPSGEKIKFYPDKRFNEDARAFFLNYFFRNPLFNTNITSPFGMRPNPFTGKMTFHNGIDLSAKPRTEVNAAKEGVVIEKGFNSVFGKYIIIKHSHGFKTFYGHLS
ncbi:MAG: M23 family metallopeptidase, partial [Spirochaetales bacterium]|nr:M23 family metallopeptidase [Spirochaetales bacterium]